MSLTSVTMSSAGLFCHMLSLCIPPQVQSNGQAETTSSQSQRSSFCLRHLAIMIVSLHMFGFWGVLGLVDSSRVSHHRNVIGGLRWLRGETAYRQAWVPEVSSQNPRNSWGQQDESVFTTGKVEKGRSWRLASQNCDPWVQRETPIKKNI